MSDTVTLPWVHGLKRSATNVFKKTSATLHHLFALVAFFGVSVLTGAVAGTRLGSFDVGLAVGTSVLTVLLGVQAIWLRSSSGFTSGGPSIV